MKIALLSDYSIEEYTLIGKEKFWSTPRGLYDAFVMNERIEEIRWYPTPNSDPSFGFNELKNIMIQMNLFLILFLDVMWIFPTLDELFDKKIFQKVS